MTFEIIQQRIADKIRKINTEIGQLESLNIDYATPEGARVDARMRLLTENVDFLEMLAFFIINQSEELETLQRQNERSNLRIFALLDISERTILRYNTAQSTMSLIQAKNDYFSKQTEEWLKKELGEEDFKLISQAA